MRQPTTPFAIRESRHDGLVRLALSGELDLGSTRVLEARLTSLRARKAAVRLDLSQLEFIDSTGLQLLIRAIGDARIDGWELSIEPQVGPQVAQLFKLVHLDHIVEGGSQEG